MSDYDKNTRIPGNLNTRTMMGGYSPTSWLAGLIIAILVIVAIGYAFSDRWSTNSGMVERRASTTDTATPSMAPAPPPPLASPAAKP